eukprot:25901-Eustigmatos_ZCMA.PRE.1
MRRSPCRSTWLTDLLLAECVLCLHRSTWGRTHARALSEMSTSCAEPTLEHQPSARRRPYSSMWCP